MHTTYGAASPRDHYYRSLVDNPTQYDKVIDWIRDNNPAAQRRDDIGTPEQFACHVVHSCIRSVLFGDSGNFCSTGMCIAVRLASDPTSSNYRKVVLAIHL